MLTNDGLWSNSSLPGEQRRPGMCQCLCISASQSPCLVPSLRLGRIWAKGEAASQDGFILQTDDMIGPHQLDTCEYSPLEASQHPRVPGTPPILPAPQGPRHTPCTPVFAFTAGPLAGLCVILKCHTAELEWQCHE